MLLGFSYWIDAFQDVLGMPWMSKPCRGAANNADYRDIVGTALILEAN